MKSEVAWCDEVSEDNAYETRGKGILGIVDNNLSAIRFSTRGMERNK